MPLYVADYKADTAHLNAAQHGAYLLLIMHYWTTGGLPIEDAPLARIACMTLAEWKKARPTIAAFFDAEWRHKRIESELARVNEISNKRRASAQQRHSKRSANAEQVDTHSHSHSQLQREEKKDAAPRLFSDPETDLFRRGKEVMGDDAGGIIAKLKKHQGSIAKARAIIETASTKHDAREYVMRILHGRSDDGFAPASGAIV